MEPNDETEYIYILSNPSIRWYDRKDKQSKPLYKIGKTARSVECRSNELYATGVADPFKIEATFSVKSITKMEDRIFNTLISYCYNPKREFYYCKLGTAIAVIERLINFYDDWRGHGTQQMSVGDVSLCASTLDDYDGW